MGSFTAKAMKNSQNRTPKGRAARVASSAPPGSSSRVMSKLFTPALTKTATIATSMKAEPRMVKIRNFIAEYSRRPVPQVEISRYIGTSSTSQNRKNSRKSSAVNTPSTAVCSTNSQMKYSRTRWAMWKDTKTAHNPSKPVSITSGALMPSTPSR